MPGSVLPAPNNGLSTQRSSHPRSKAGTHPRTFRKQWIPFARTKRAYNHVRSGLHRAIRGEPKEERKLIITQSWKGILLRISIHFFPVATAAVLIALNSRGCFIGGEYAGKDSPVVQSIDVLCLQVAAKLFVCMPPWL